jgi:hypothetical protein
MRSVKFHTIIPIVFLLLSTVLESGRMRVEACSGGVDQIDATFIVNHDDGEHCFHIALSSTHECLGCSLSTVILALQSSFSCSLSHSACLSQILYIPSNPLTLLTHSVSRRGPPALFA